MNVNPLLMSLSEKMDVPVFPDFCDNMSLDRYIAFNYISEKGARFGDNKVISEITQVQVHYFMRDRSVQQEKMKLRQCLTELGFKHSVGAELYEEDTRLNHIVIICEISGKPDYI